ncbi:sulfurtransferase [Thiopseudomonas alkaliphila]|uniref:sulfurtransferase n=1 Tax=Thiopseudomonas alkaliphila TaxID=1697053 RepID=UPI003571165A
MYPVQLFIITLLLFCRLVAAEGLTPLIEPEQLAAYVASEQPLTVLDIRTKDEYQQGHVQGAVSAPYALWRGPANNPGQLLTQTQLQGLAQQLGLVEQPIVIYSSGSDETDFGAAARVYWTLKYMGFEQLSIVNGGLAYWQKQGYPLDQQPVQPQPSTTAIQLRPELVILQPELLQKVQQPSALTQLLDARPRLFYQGTVKAPTASVPGTIASAQSLEFSQWFSGKDNRLKSPSEIKQLIQHSGLMAAKETVSFCNTGHWAATNWFVLSEIGGLTQVRLYPASLAEWTQSQQALPMENTPTRLEQIHSKFKQLVEAL